jgi:hypothetical protein
MTLLLKRRHATHFYSGFSITAKKGVARRANHSANPKQSRVVNPSRQKYISSVFRKYMVLSLHPASMKRDERVVTIVRRGCDGREKRARRARRTRTAKPCGPDAPTLASSPRSDRSRATVANKPGHRGERGAAVNTIAQGMPTFWLTCSDVARVLLSFAHEAMGAARRPVFPAPSSFFKGRACLHHPGAIASRDCGGVSPRHCEERSDKIAEQFCAEATKQSRSLHGNSLDCFASLAMTDRAEVWAGDARRVPRPRRR